VFSEVAEIARVILIHHFTHPHAITYTKNEAPNTFFLSGCFSWWNLPLLVSPDIKI